MEITNKELLIIRAALAVYEDMLEFEYSEILELQPEDEEYGCIDEAVDYFSAEITALRTKIETLTKGGGENGSR